MKDQYLETIMEEHKNQRLAFNFCLFSSSPEVDTQSAKNALRIAQQTKELGIATLQELAKQGGILSKFDSYLSKLSIRATGSNWEKY